MRRRWHTFRRLNRQEWRLLADAMVSLTVAWIGLRTIGYGRTRSILCRVSPLAGTGAYPNRGYAIMRQATWSIAASASAIPMAITCLDRSLALWWLLRRRNIDCDLRIGTAQTENGVAAHAWLERDGVVLNDSKDVTERFSTFSGLR